MLGLSDPDYDDPYEPTDEDQASWSLYSSQYNQPCWSIQLNPRLFQPEVTLTSQEPICDV